MISITAPSNDKLPPTHQDLALHSANSSKKEVAKAEENKPAPKQDLAQQDTVHISLNAQIQHMKQIGASTEQISSVLGISTDEVNQALGTVTRKTSASAVTPTQSPSEARKQSAADLLEARPATS